MVEYEVVDIKLTRDGRNFVVKIKSEFGPRDEWGEIKEEVWQFPVKYLEEDRWKKIIEQNLLKRALEKEEEVEKGIDTIEKKLEIIESLKQKHKGKISLKKKFEELKALREKEKAIRKKILNKNVENMDGGVKNDGV